MTIKVFCYGSNMCRARLQRRVGRCEWLEPAQLPGHQFRFHKRGKDLSGKADAFYTGSSQDQIWGALAVLSERAKYLLDGYEGLGSGYREKAVQAVTSEGTRHQALIYVAMDEYIDDRLKPFDWYQHYVLIGAAEHALPAPYVDVIRGYQAVPDEDPDRRQYNSQISAEAARLVRKRR